MVPLVREDRRVRPEKRDRQVLPESGVETAQLVRGESRALRDLGDRPARKERMARRENPVQKDPGETSDRRDLLALAGPASRVGRCGTQTLVA
jgi:hypothetical protein